MTGTKQDDYHFRSIQDTTIITNKTVDTAMQAAGTFVANSVVPLNFLALTNGDICTVTIKTTTTGTAHTATATFESMLLPSP